MYKYVIEGENISKFLWKELEYLYCMRRIYMFYWEDIIVIFVKIY